MGTVKQIGKTKKRTTQKIYHWVNIAKEADCDMIIIWFIS